MADRKERAYDSYLVASARIGDKLALERLAQRWHPKLLGHAHRLTGEPDLAAEAAQEAWLDIMRGIGGLDDADAFPAWAMRIVSRRCARIIRGRQRWRRKHSALAGEPEVPSDTPETVTARGEATAVRIALAGLSADQKAAIGLFYLEEMSVAEVAVALEVPVGTVKSRLMHARNKLRNLLVGGNHD